MNLQQANLEDALSAYQWLQTGEGPIPPTVRSEFLFLTLFHKCL